MKQNTVWSFFSGAGGLDLGFEQAGLAPQLRTEFDRQCVSTLCSNRPDDFVVHEDACKLRGSDLRELTGHYGDIDVMIGGPPCQSFSTAGNRRSFEDPRGNLTAEYLRLVRELNPKLFVLENVASIVTAAIKHRPIDQRPGRHWSLAKYDRQDITSDDAEPLAEEERGGTVIRRLLADIQALGYASRFFIVRASDYGAPQHRYRFALLASRDTEAPAIFPPTHGEDESLHPFKTVRDAIWDLRKDPGAHSTYTDEVARFFQLIPPGGNWRSLPKDLWPEAMGKSYSAGGGKTGFFRRLPWDAPSPTITCRPNRKGTAMCHPLDTRSISVHESARLQGFPDEWQISGSMSQQYLQIGNAVPVPLAKMLGDCVYQHLQRKNHGEKPSVDEEEIVHRQDLDRAVAFLRASARNKRSSGTQKQKRLFDKDIA